MKTWYRVVIDVAFEATPSPDGVANDVRAALRDSPYGPVDWNVVSSKRRSLRRPKLRRKVRRKKGS